ncbi:MAG: hypothetical protein LUD02_07665 [Tannerellaceae bacterium]|nr:hypothetical protein [Tannerellaceae bacterium]MCD8264039.1 hypothetical protein [Tannerellaceae bacterium]
MALKYKVVTRKVLASDDAGQIKYYGKVCTNNRITFDMLCNEISSYCTATKGDIAIVLQGLETCMIQDLAAGHVIQMGDLGNFRMTGGSHGAVTEEEFTLHLMKRPRITLSSGKLLKRLCKEATFTHANVQVVKVPEDCQQGHTI